MIDFRKINQIPSNFPGRNESFIQYCIKYFESFHYVSIIDQLAVDQFFAGKASKRVDESFDALSNYFNIGLKEVGERDEDRIKAFAKTGANERVGVVSFHIKQEKNRHAEKEKEQPSNHFSSRTIELTGRSLIGDCRAMLLSSIEKRKKRTKWKLIIPLIILGLIGLGISFVVLNNTVGAAPDETGGSPKVRISRIFSPIMIALVVVLLGMLFFDSFISKKGKKQLETDLDKALKKEKEEAKRREEERKKNLVNSAFTIIVKGENEDAVNVSLERIKRGVETLFAKNGLEVEGRIIIEGKGFSEKVRRLLGWSVNSFRQSFRKWSMFKADSVPISSASHFFQLKANLPGSQEIIHPFRYEVERRAGDWYVGQQVFSPQLKYDFYLNASDLTRSGLIVGPTGSGKTSFTINMLSKMMKFHPHIHFIIFDLKGEYARFFAREEDVLLLIPGSKAAPLGLNIFKIDAQNIDSNKRFVRNLLQDFLHYAVASNAELSPFMEDISNQAIDQVFKLPFAQRTLKNFVWAINDLLDRYAKEGLSWSENTRVALRSRFRKLFTDWFERVFSVEQSNFDVQMLRRDNIIVRLDHLNADNDLGTIKLIVNTIMNLISRGSKELYDFESNEPWLVAVFEEAQKIVPRIKKTDSSELSAIESFMEISRAYGVSSIAIGQNPLRISERFEQAGLLVDFGTEARILDNIIFTGEEDPSAIASKEKLRLKKRMCFVKLPGLKRVLLEVAELQTQNALSKEQIRSLLHESGYRSLRENYSLDSIADFDLEGEKGRRRLVEERLLKECKKDCNRNSCHFEEFSQKNRLLSSKTNTEIKSMMREGTFVNYAWTLVKDKDNASCIILYYLIQLVVAGAITLGEAFAYLKEGKEELCYI